PNCEWSISGVVASPSYVPVLMWVVIATPVVIGSGIFRVPSSSSAPVIPVVVVVTVALVVRIVVVV
ncbi:hypothetical protein A2U01_0069516, partial [Trifolium medium]|nr:hypothetical protein [Trifolium medium]